MNEVKILESEWYPVFTIAESERAKKYAELSATLTDHELDWVKNGIRHFEMVQKFLREKSGYEG